MALRRGFATKVQWGLRPFQKAQKCPSTRITTPFFRPIQKPLDTVDEVGIVATRRPLRLLLIPYGAASPLDTVAEKGKGWRECQLQLLYEHVFRSRVGKFES